MIEAIMVARNKYLLLEKEGVPKGNFVVWRNWEMFALRIRALQERQVLRLESLSSWHAVRRGCHRARRVRGSQT